MGAPFSSLRTRILVMATVPLVGLLATVMWIGHRTTTRSVEDAAASRLDDAASVVAELVASQHRALEIQARVTASDPRFFATFSVPEEERGEDFRTTMELVSSDFLRITDADFLEIYDPQGSPLVRRDRSEFRSAGWTDPRVGEASLTVAMQRAVSKDLFLSGDDAVMVADVPVFLGSRQAAVLRMGRWVDEDFGDEIQRLTGADYAIGRSGRVVLGSREDVDLARPEGEEKPEERSGYRTRARPWTFADEAVYAVDLGFAGVGPDSGFTVRLARSTAAELAELRRAEQLMFLVGLAALVATLLAGISIAVGVTRPLRALMGFARSIRDGDYTRPVPVHGNDEIAVVAEALEESRQSLHAHVRRLEELDRRRGEFIALAGHEIRTPLTVITSFNDMLHEGAFGELPAEVEETTGLIGEQLAQLNELVTDILDLTALETAPGKAISKTEFELGELVSRLEEEQRELRASRDIDFRWSPPAAGPWVDGDERLLGRAIRSLLDNAVRFTPDGGRVEVLLLVKHGHAELSVVDSGVGIHPDEVRWIFDKLFEGGDLEHHSSGRLEFRSGGLGIGLSIARAVIEAHGGQLSVESQPGQGSCFTATIPLSTRPGRAVEELPGIERTTPEGLRC